jgi:nitroreductase
MATEKYPFIKYKGDTYTEEEMIQRAESFYQFMNKRRSVRQFSNKDVPKEVIDNIIRTAGTAPSGAHKEPWKFCVIRNSELKSQIRALAEEEERINYESRMSDRWLKDLEPFGTDHVKEFIDVAPWVIIVLKETYGLDEQGNKIQNYYVNESVGIASGMLIAAIHNAGLVTLTHTPSPMNFITKALGRPENEKPFLLIPVGYPAEDCEVPALTRKELKDITIYYK